MHFPDAQPLDRGGFQPGEEATEHSSPVLCQKHRALVAVVKPAARTETDVEAAGGDASGADAAITAASTSAEPGVKISHVVQGGERV